MLNFVSLEQAQIAKGFQSREQVVLLPSGFGLYFSVIKYFPCLFSSTFPGNKSVEWIMIGKIEEIADPLARDKEKIIGSPIHLEMTKQMS